MTLALALRHLRHYGLASLIFVSVLVALAGCSNEKPVFTGSDISGTHLGRGLSLTGMDGKHYTDHSFEGKVTLVFFGLGTAMAESGAESVDYKRVR